MEKHIILKKLVAITLAAITAASAFGMNASAASVADFTDVKPGAWYYPAVEYATDNQLFQGTTPTTFSPNGSVTRGMFVTVLGRKAGVNIKDYPTTRFKDVKSSIYYAPYVEWAATYGIVSGTDEKKALFSPDKTVTREQMASILYRFAQATENDVDYSGEKFYSFSDYGKVSSFAQDAFKWASDKGIINGSDGKLNPKGTATRAQVAQVFLSAQYVLTKTEITIDPIPAPEPDPAADFEPVPINKLANLKSIKKALTDNQMKQVYDIAVDIVRSSMFLDTTEQKAFYIARKIARDYNKYEYTSSTKHCGDPYGVFIEKKATCSGFTRTMGLCLNIMGLPYEHVNEGLWEHQWCRVKINGKYWACDAYTEPYGLFSLNGILYREDVPYDFPSMGGYVGHKADMEKHYPTLPAFQCTLESCLNGETLTAFGTWGQGERKDYSRIDGYLFDNKVGRWIKNKNDPAEQYALNIDSGVGPYTVIVYLPNDQEKVFSQTFNTTFTWERTYEDYNAEGSIGGNYVDVTIIDYFGRQIGLQTHY